VSSTASKQKLRVHHVGVIVADLDAAIDYYRVLLQEEPAYVMDPVEGPYVDEGLGYQGAVLKLAGFPLGDSFFEVMEYVNPTGVRLDPENYNIGHTHVALEVQDIDAEFERLRAAGVEFRSSAPITVIDTEGGHGGVKFAYMRGPDGNTIELFQLPETA
jgi:catechol 2,3-dioxygenase-like lactoylglutathione lyase family enzyme